MSAKEARNKFDTLNTKEKLKERNETLTCQQLNDINEDIQSAIEQGKSMLFKSLYNTEIMNILKQQGKNKPKRTRIIL